VIHTDFLIPSYYSYSLRAGPSGIESQWRIDFPRPSLRGMKRLGLGTNHPHHLVPRLKNIRTIPLHPFWIFMICLLQGEIYLYIFNLHFSHLGLRYVIQWCTHVNILTACYTAQYLSCFHKREFGNVQIKIGPG
jgi:hypothetical protein